MSYIGSYSTEPRRYVTQEEIHRKTISSKLLDRRGAAFLFRYNFARFTDRGVAFEDLHRLTQDEDQVVRKCAAESLGEVFPYIADKGVAFEDLHRLANDKDFFVKRAAVLSLCTAFPYIIEEDMEEAWEDIQQLTQDKKSDVRRIAALSLGVAFPYISGKNIVLAWEGLHRLAKDRKSDVRSVAALSLGSAFPYISYIPMEQIWEDLHQLANESNSDVQLGAAYSLGVAFPLIPNEEQAWEDLNRLSQNRNSYVQACANFSLGRASIFKAANAKSVGVFREELKTSLNFFSISLTKEVIGLSLFCLSLYSSFYAIIFEGKKAELEVQEYVEKARIALGRYGYEEKFFEAVENCRNFLKEIQGIKNANLRDMERNLIVCMQYCNRSDFLELTEEELFPVEINIISKVLPLIDQRIIKKVYTTHYKSLNEELLTPQKWECASCGTSVPSGARFCPHCGKVIDKCPVCSGSISPGEALTECPRCGVLCHRDHLLEWIKAKGYCPSCKGRLSQEDIFRMGLL